MKSVYAVTSGCYSDYSVHAVFEDKPDAQAHAAQISSGDVEEMPYYPKGERPEMVTIWTASATGPDFELEMRSHTEPAYDGEVAVLKGKRPKVHESSRYLRLRHGHERVPYLSCTSLDDVAARKAVADRAAQIKAATAGIS